MYAKNVCADERIVFGLLTFEAEFDQVGGTVLGAWTLVVMAERLQNSIV